MRLNLKGTPRPHYLRDGSFEKTDRGWEFSGTAIFPKEDPHLADRSRANVAHLELAAWAAAHDAARKRIVNRRLRIIAGVGSYRREVPLDEEIEVCMAAKFRSTSGSRQRGFLTSSFYLHGVLLAHIRYTFIADK